MATMGERRRALRRTSDRTRQQVLNALGLVDGQWAAIESGKIADPRVIVVAALAEHDGADLGAFVNAQPTAALSPESRAIVRLFEDHLTPAPACRS